MFLVISEMHFPIHTQNAVFLTALQHFLHVTFTTSVLYPKPQALSQPRKWCLSDCCGLCKGRWVQTVHLLLSLDSCPLWWHLALLHTSLRMLWYRWVLYTILVMVSHGSRWAWERHTNPYTECALIPLPISVLLSQVPERWLVTLVTTLDPLPQVAPPHMPLAISLYVTVVISQVPRFTVARFS